MLENIETSSFQQHKKEETIWYRNKSLYKKILL